MQERKKQKEVKDIIENEKDDYENNNTKDYKNNDITTIIIHQFIFVIIMGH
jgi:hypothetical protein